jgi:hypothetical protein
MKSNIEALMVAGLVFAAALGFSGGATARWFGPLPQGTGDAHGASVSVPDTPIDVQLSGPVSSETARPGDIWRGTVLENVVRQHDVLIPAGTQVTGIITAASSARHAPRAMLELSVRALELDAGAPPSEAQPAPSLASAFPVGIPTEQEPGSLDLRSAAQPEPAAGSDAVMGVVAGTPAARVMAVESRVPIALKQGAVMRFSLDHTVAVR